MSRLPKPDRPITPYPGPAGGWGSVRSVGNFLLREHVPAKGAAALMHQNKPDGFMCVSCGWAKPSRPHPFEYCENGAKATAWDITPKRTGRRFFADHTLRELESWSDHDLEAHGRLTEPLRFDPATDTYVPVSWDQAFQAIGAALRAIPPDRAVFYASGRAGLEAAYMFQLMARLYGTNNLPDCSNMCHESSSVGLPESLGAAVGTAVLSDFENCDCIFYIGQNVGTSSPRMLHDLQDARIRGVPIITFNLLRERGLERFTDPQDPREMLGGRETQISTEYYQVKNGGDIAALMGVCKALIAWDDAQHAGGASAVTGEDDRPRDPASAAEIAFAASVAAADSQHVLDHDFITTHTAGFEAFAEAARDYSWAALEHASGLTRAEMEQAARSYGRARAVLLIYGMGLTQHVMGVQNVHMVCNLALLRGNIGKPGGNVCAVRGHSNVQGQRTVGITEKRGLVPVDKLRELYGFTVPPADGMSTVDACQGIIAGGVDALIALGGNFLRAVPETAAIEAAWRKLPLTVQIATKLNRSHVIHGRDAFLLPCLSRLEIDQQASGAQAVSIESSVAHFHGSRGTVAPASPELRSEPAIIAGIAEATLPPNELVPWQRWVSDYALIRDAIERTYPETFKDFNQRLFQPGGFARPLPARERKWVTRSGRANFLTPDRLSPDLTLDGPDDEVLMLATLRSNDQFNTTIYGDHDRFRGVRGTRRVVFMNRADIARLGLADGEAVDLTTALADATQRRIHGLRIVAYDIPQGCCGAYYPEANPLVPLSHHDPKSKVPAYKAIPVRVSRPSLARAATLP